MTFSPTIEEMGKRVRAMVAESTGLAGNRVLLANQGGETPTDSFATVLDIDHVVRGQPWKRRGDTVVTMEITYSVQFYRAGAQEMATRLVGWFHTDDAADFSTARGFVNNSASPSRDLSDVVSDEFEDRAGVDITITCRLVLTQEPIHAFAPRDPGTARDEGAFGPDHTIRIEA